MARREPTSADSHSNRRHLLAPALITFGINAQSCRSAFFLRIFHHHNLPRITNERLLDVEDLRIFCANRHRQRSAKDRTTQYEFQGELQGRGAATFG